MTETREVAVETKRRNRIPDIFNVLAAFADGRDVDREGFKDNVKVLT